jgi:hypothetical protein
MGRAALFALLAAALLAAVVRWGPPTSGPYTAATVLKHDRLRALASPKVVLVGGSNLAYGVDSERLGRALCRPVANMGLTVALGFSAMVNEVAGELGPGDIVIVAPECSLLREPDRVDEAMAAVFDYRPEVLWTIPWYERPRVLGAVAGMHLQRFVEELPEGLRDGRWPHGKDRLFIPNGDLVEHLALPPLAVKAGPAQSEFDSLHVSSAFHPIARRLMDAAGRAGAQVVFSWASIADTVYRAEEHEAVRRALVQEGYPVVGVPGDYAFADSLFYDTWYHLTGTGRSLRTDRLIRDLCAAHPEWCCRKP